MRTFLKFSCLLWLLLCSLPWSHATDSKSIPEIFPAQGTVQVAFSPWDDTEGVLIDAIAAAKTQILVQAYLLTSRAIALGLIDAKQHKEALSLSGRLIEQAQAQIGRKQMRLSDCSP